MPQDNDHPGLRASDADRDEVAQLLADALADGRLTTGEYHERLDRLYAAGTQAQLVHLTADLGDADPVPARRPGAHPAVERVAPQIAVLGETMARPTGSVRGRLTAVSVLGNVQIDLSYATIDESVEINAKALLGAVNITVPADARVHMSGVPLGGSLSPTREPGPADGPKVTVKALTGLGSVTIHRADGQ